MEALVSALEVLKFVWGPISRRIGYVYNLKKKFEELNRKVDKLHHRVEDVNRKISNAGKRPTSECEGWLKEVEKIQNKWKEIEDEYQKNKTCLGGWCPDVCSCLNLGKRIEALINEIDLTEKSDFKEDTVIDEPQKIMEMPAPRVEVNTAAGHILQELLGMIKEDGIKRIGLWGMGGVGKTTIMKVLHNHPEIVQMFEIVLWVTVSKEGTCRNVQDELAKRLSVKGEGESNDSLKSRVFRTLKAKKFLLLLDDVWDMIDLEEVGVPHLDEGNGCKVVLSTRSVTVCNKMRTDKEIQVKALSEQEAWSLFRREVGEVADYPVIEPLAREVAIECCGLPLAIVVVGGALRKEEDIHVWRNALKELRSSVSNKIDDMEEKVYRRLKYSYDRLKDERSKECFLYCALFPEDWEISEDELIQYWVTEGLIDGWNNLEEAEDKGFSKLKGQLDASLLEKGAVFGFTEETVKMHDVMRDLALRLSSAMGEGCRSLVKAGVKLSEAPKAEDWEKVKRISLMKNHLPTLPQMPNCRMLTTLLLQGNYELREIPPHFFEHMPALQVLNLSETGIESLPPSIGSLGNLRGLYLNNCPCLKVVSRQVGALAKLKIFQMKGHTRVCYLPPEIGDLASLKHFEVRCCPSVKTDEEEQLQVMKTFPKMSKLSGLERLGILIAAEDDEWWGEYSEGVSREIIMLNKLTQVSLSFSKIEHRTLCPRKPILEAGKLDLFQFHRRSGRCE